MQEALQLRSHLRQLMHLSVSITGLSHEKRARKLRKVPTGHIVLHQVRPFLHASTAISTSITAAMMNVGRLLSHTSVE